MVGNPILAAQRKPTKRRDDFDAPVKVMVAERVNYRCSNPDCRAATRGPQVNPTKSLNVGVAAHITAASPGGPRYDPKLTSKQRKSINNAIWLCQTCGKLIDNDEVGFPETLMRAWKTEAEEEARFVIGKAAPAQISKPTFPIFHVPLARNPFFTGRAELLESLKAALVGDATVALTQPQAVSGLGGVGKTQIAVEYAHTHADQYTVVFWIRAATLSDLESGFLQLARALHLPEKDEIDQAQIQVAVRRWLESNDGWLLVFDNADEPNLVKPFLPSRLRGHVIFTSRRRTLQELGVVNSLEVQVLPLEDALSFLLRRTGSPSVVSDERNAAEQLAQELGCLPLALEQAAAYIAETSINFSDYLAAYRSQRLQRLESQKPVAGDYPESVATTWEINFAEIEATSPTSAEFMRLAAFLEPDDVPLEIIVNGGAFLSDALVQAFHPDEREQNPLFLEDVLKPLTRYSLLQRDLKSNTYSVHRLVQAVMRDRLDDAEQRLWAERIVLVLTYFYVNPQFQSLDRASHERLTSQDKCGVDLVFEWDMRFQEAADFLFNVADPLCAYGLRLQVQPLLERSLEITEKNLGPEEPRLASVLSQLSFALLERAKYDKAREFSDRALTIIQKTFGEGSSEEVGFLQSQAIFNKMQGRYSEAEQLFQQAFDALVKEGGPEDLQVARVLGDWAEMRYSQGRNAEAEVLFDQALPLFRRKLKPAHPDLGVVLNNYAALLGQLGRLREAENAQKEAVKIEEAQGRPPSPLLAMRLANLASLLNQQQKPQEAAPLIERSLGILRATVGSQNIRVATALAISAASHAAQSQISEAEADYQEAIAILESIDIKHRELPRLMGSYANFLKTQGREVDSHQIFSRAQWIQQFTEPRATMGRFGGRSVIMVEWEERISLKLLRESWHQTIGDASDSIEEAMKRRLEDENPGWFVANVKAQCFDTISKWSEARDDEIVATTWDCSCIVRIPDDD